MDNNVLLSVCIPTYNRLSEIKECLDSVIPQNTESIEIFVSDNSSNNDTQEYIESILDKFENLRYKHNVDNLGADGNFLQCLQMAKGKYVMLLSDDDKLKEDFIEHILTFLKTHDEVDFIETNSMGFKEDKVNRDSVHLQFGESKVYEKENFEDFFNLFGVQLTFVSSMIFNKASFDSIINPSQYMNTSLLQTHLAIECMQRLKRVALIPNAVVYARGNNGSGYNIYEVFIKNWRDVLYKTAVGLNVINKKTARNIFSNTIRNFITGYLIQEKLEGKLAYNTNKKAKYFRYAFFTKGAWTRLYPVWLMPRFILVALLNRRKK